MTTATEGNVSAALETWDLVQKVQAGDTEAYGQIYDRYVDLIYRFIAFRTSNDRELTEDLTAETFLKALKYINSFQWQGRDFGSWLVTIARNRVFDHYKSGQVRRECLQRHEGAQLGKHTDDADKSPEGCPEELVTQHLVNVELLRAVKALPPAQQECIVLRFLMGRTVDETATIIGKNVGVVKSRQYRAVRSLRRALPELAESMVLTD